MRERRWHRRNLIVKARQHGITTLYCIDLLDEALWVPGTTCAILAHEREANDKIFEIVKRAFTNLPEGLKPDVKTDTVRMYKFTHRFDGLPLDSSIYVALKLRGGTVFKLHITESAYIKDRAELDSGSKQAVPKEGWITEETTGHGYDLFYDSYIEAIEKQKSGKLGELDYKPYFYAWFENDEYSLDGELSEEEKRPLERKIQAQFNLTDGQLLWRRWKMDELRRKQEGIGLTGDQLFKQEYPATYQEAFQSGAGNVFDTLRIEAMQPLPMMTLQECQAKVYGTDEEKKKMLERLDYLFKKGVKIYRMPEPGKKYELGCDPSDGTGSDNSAVSVWDCNDDEKNHQMAQFYGKVRPDELAEIIKELGWFYNEAFAGVESNQLSTILFLSKIYSRYYYRVVFDERSQKRTKKLGWRTDTKTRDVLIDDYIKLFEEDHLQVNSVITLKEMRTFVTNENGKREHAVGKHDDALFADFIALQMHKFSTPRARAFERKPTGF